MQDEGFHEIQLNGKQLVFLFMAVTVVAVVIFLCGVMVGRGVATERADADRDVPSQAGVELDPTAPAEPELPQTARGPSAESNSENDPLSYGPRLQDPSPPSETLRPSQDDAPAVSTPRPSPSVRTARAPSPAPAPVPPADARFKEPPGQGFVVQVAALRQRAEAEAMARRLSAKGYQTFVTTSGAHYRVRVGKYSDRAAARAVATRLEREEHFKPWIPE